MSADRLIHRYTHTHIRQLMSYELVYTSIHSSNIIYIYICVSVYVYKEVVCTLRIRFSISNSIGTAFGGIVHVTLASTHLLACRIPMMAAKEQPCTHLKSREATVRSTKLGGEERS